MSFDNHPNAAKTQEQTHQRMRQRRGRHDNCGGRILGGWAYYQLSLSVRMPFMELIGSPMADIGPLVGIFFGGWLCRRMFAR